MDVLQTLIAKLMDENENFEGNYEENLFSVLDDEEL